MLKDLFGQFGFRKITS